MANVRISVIYVDNKVDSTKQICSTSKAEINSFKEGEDIYHEMAYSIAIEIAKNSAGHDDIVYISHKLSLD